MLSLLSSAICALERLIKNRGRSRDQGSVYSVFTTTCRAAHINTDPKPICIINNKKKEDEEEGEALHPADVT